MRYIRTKQGHVYKRLYKDGALNRGVGYIVEGVIMPYGEDIIKESDAIEELCDEFVLAKVDFIVLNKEHTQFRFKGKDEWLDITEIESKRGIYGAIWTDKGLIYVAKMNKKGELELL